MIREVLEKDFSSIYLIGSLLHENFEQVYNLNYLCKQSYFHMYVYEEENEILGFLSFTDLDGEIDLLDLVVDEKYRRKKIATQLMNRFITNSPIGGKIYLEVAVDNYSAISLYDKFGFDIISTRKNYYKNKDAYVMERVNKNE